MVTFFLQLVDTAVCFAKRQQINVRARINTSPDKDWPDHRLPGSFISYKFKTQLRQLIPTQEHPMLADCFGVHLLTVSSKFRF